MRVAANLDQSGVALHLEVTRDARLVHADLLDQLAHGPLAVSDRVEDPMAGRLGDDIEHSERGRHLLGIRQSVYMGQRTYLWAPSLEHQPGLGWGRGVAEGACRVLAGHSDGGSVVVVGRRR